ncbi:MAG: hypothetical protein ACE1Y4_11260, partial [Lysobacterales bacterium]
MKCTSATFKPLASFGIWFLLLFVLLSPAAAQSWIELLPTGGPSDNIIPRQPAGVAYDAANNRLIVYFPSNLNRNGSSYEVWVLTNANGLGGIPNWNQLAPGGTLVNHPNNINFGHSAVYDAAENRLIVYGGCDANCGSAQSSVYVLSNANGLGGTPVWSASSFTNPQGRASHSAVLDPTSNLMIAFAGHLAFFG